MNAKEFIEKNKPQIPLKRPVGEVLDWNDVFILMEEYASLPDKWISVKDELPKEWGEYLVLDQSDGLPYIAEFEEYDGFSVVYRTVHPLWWQHLPKSPIN